MNRTEFGNVVSARICLVARSENEVMDQITSYVDCEGNEQTPADKPRNGAAVPMAGARCPECANPTLIHKDGCEFCTTCGYIGACG